jgi:hypothetical protein
VSVFAFSNKGGYYPITLDEIITNGIDVRQYGEAIAPPAFETLINSYTVPTGKTLYLAGIIYNGNHVAEIRFKVNSILENKVRTTWMNPSGVIPYGYQKFESGNVLEIFAYHTQEGSHSFNAVFLGKLN